MKMYNYIARQPVFDRDLDIFGYELLYRDGPNNTFPNNTTIGITERIFVEQHLAHQGIILEGKVGFVNFDYDDLINKLPLEFPKEQYIIEVLETCSPDKELMTTLLDLKMTGYRIALDDFCVNDSRWNSFIKIADIIKFDIQKTPLKDIRNLIGKLRNKNISVLAEKVENYSEYEEAKNLGFDYFQGYFFSKPQLIKRNKLDETFKANMELLQEVSKYEYSLMEVERIISSCPALTIRLLNYVNSQISIRSKICSLNQAINYLGKDRVKRFSSHLIISMCPPSKPKSLFINALYRANLLQDLANTPSFSEILDKAYITGMISLIDALLDVDMAQFLSALNLNDEIGSAILFKDGKLGRLLLLTESLEKGDWDEVDKFQSEYPSITPTAPKRYIDIISRVNAQFE
ncbi:EAL and HDOD domain-containing protein [Vibrio fluvialis]|uniref:EAL and HDOD domain-containing protein n=1 Tax=Vibrio fluvialis TaxID=676 RepID=UPI001C9CFAEE|nr:EAL domain-containing protein [Vibrio fluvialis]MBY8169354.1 EAL domain-containing protein [Vibrio fluvialis]